MIVTEQILKLVRFIVGTARECEFSRLSTIHIVKYLYMADFFNAKSEGRTLTSWKWKFWDFGPWAIDSYHAVNNAASKGFISSEARESKYHNLDESNEYHLFYCDQNNLTDDELETLGREVLPNIRTRIAIQGIIKKYGNKTNSLLHYIYSTEPLMGKKRGDFLSFEGLAWPKESAAPTIPMGKKKLKKAKEIIKRIKERRPPIYSPPPGKFDDVYLSEIKNLEVPYISYSLAPPEPSEDCILEETACVKDIDLDD